MTQVYIGFSIHSTADGTCAELRNTLFGAADSIGLDTSLCQCMHQPETDDIHGSNPQKMDLFKSDITKLLNAKCAILDLTNPSHDIGFCAGYLFADRPKLPVLGLVSNSNSKSVDSSGRKSLSALIAGCPAVTIREYDPTRAREQLPRIMHEWLVSVGLFVPRPVSGPIILLAGPPGAGKTTQGRLLSRHLGIPHISTGELLRQLPATHALYSQFATHLANGTLVPALIMKRILLERLSQKDCHSGYILDGYPVDADDFQNLKELGVQPTLIIQICADRTTCIRRQLDRGERANDKDVALATRRLDTYISRFPSLLDTGDALGLVEEFKVWFPDCKHIAIDTTLVGRTTDRIFNGILNLSNFSFPVPPITHEEWESLVDYKSNSTGTRIHFHIDAADQELVTTLAKKSGLPCKVYPIDTLLIQGSRQINHPDYAKTYAKMPNFATDISPGDWQAFATGILTEETIPRYLEFMNEIAQVPEGERGKMPIMTRVEEYIWIQKLFFNSAGKRDGIETKDYSAGAGSWTGWSSLSHRTRELMAAKNTLTRVGDECYEIHHALDIPKLSVNRHELNDWLKSPIFSQRMGNIGGIFIFENPGVWAVRTNEFYNGPYDDCKAIALEQQRNIVCPWQIREIETSIELVHGIWTTV